MGGSLEAFKLFCSLEAKPATQSTTTTTPNNNTSISNAGDTHAPSAISTASKFTPVISNSTSSSTPTRTPNSESEVEGESESDATLSSSNSSTNDPNTAMDSSTPGITSPQPPVPTNNEGLKICLASMQDYTRRQQSLRELEGWMATYQRE